METEELWGKGWSLRTEQDPRTMTYLGTVTKSGIHFHYYRDDDFLSGSGPPIKCM